jgi:hypothetical protein
MIPTHGLLPKIRKQPLKRIKDFLWLFSGKIIRKITTCGAKRG